MEEIITSKLRPFKALEAISEAMFFCKFFSKKAFLFALLIACSSTLLHAQSVSAYAGTAATAINGGNIDWTNSANATGAGDNVYATVILDDDEESYQLNLSNFGFVIPNGDNIDGIEVIVEWYSDHSNRVDDENILLINASGTVAGIDKATGANLTAIENQRTFGSATNLWTTWGLNLTETDIEDPDFGCSITIKKNGTAGATYTNYIDFVQIIVYHSTPPAATTYYSTVSGDWSNSATWSTSCGGAGGAGVPGAGDIVYICSGDVVNIGAAAACTDLFVNSGGTLTFATGNMDLTVSGNATVIGTVTATSNGADLTVIGDLDISGSFTTTTSMILAVGGNFYLTGVLTLDGTGDANITGDVIMNNGTINLDKSTTTLNITGNLVTSASSGSNIITGANTGATYTPVTVGGNITVGASSSLDFGAAKLTVTGITDIDGTFNFTGSANGAKIFMDDITISSTGTWDNANGEEPHINADIFNNGSWIGCTGGTCTYTFGAEASGTYTVTGNPVAMSNLDVDNGSTLINIGTISLDGTGSNVLTSTSSNGIFINGDGTTTGTLYLSNGTATSVSANITFNTSNTNNAVNFSRAGDQDIRIPDDNCYYNLVCSASGIKSITGTTGVINLLTIEDDAIVNVGTNSLQDGCSGSGGLTMTDNAQLLISVCDPTIIPELSGTYNLTGASSITLGGVCDQTISAHTYNTLILDGSGVKDICNAIAINGDLTVQGSATVNMCPGIAMNCSSTFNYNSTGTTTLGGNIGIGNFSQTAGILNDGGFTITTCGSSWNRTNATTGFVATGKVIFNPSLGSVAVTSSAAGNITEFNNVTINSSKTLVGDVNGMNIGAAGSASWTNHGSFTHNSGTVTSVGTISIAGSAITTFNNLTISAGQLTGHATEMIVEGDWTNNSSFARNNGLVTFSGAAAQSLGGSATTLFHKLTINKTAGTTLTQTAGFATVNNLLTLSEGIFNVGANILNGTGDFTATGGDLQLGLTSATVPQLNGTYSITGGTVTLNGAGIQTLNTGTTGADTYYNLVFATSDIKTITGLTTINGDVTVSGTATIDANSAFVQAAAKTFTYSSSGTSTLTSALGVSVGNYTQTAGTLDINSNAANAFTVLGTAWNKTGGTFTSASPSGVIFNGTSAQTFTDDGTLFSNVTIDNAAGITLNNDMSISTDLTFTNGVITTGANNVILTATTTTVAGAGTGKFVEGNLRKAIAAGASAVVYEVGTGTDYTPINFSFGGSTTAGDLTCSSTIGDNPGILASDINASQSVNRYWTMVNNSIATMDYSATFNFIDPADIDAAFDAAINIVQNYNGITWLSPTVGTHSSTSTEITGMSSPTSGSTESFQLGNNYIAETFWNRVTGTGNNWSDQTTWIQDRKGGITSSTASTTVTGSGTEFLTEILVGDVIMSQVDPGTVIGTVASVTNDLSLELTGNAAADNAGVSFGRQQVPGILDRIHIGNLNLTGAPVTVDVDIPNAICNRIYFTSMGQSNTLSHNTGSNLDVTTSVKIEQPTTANTNSWNINDGTVNVGGNVQLGSNDATANFIARAYLTTGTLTIGTNLFYYTTVAANGILDLTGGAGTVNLAGTLSLLTDGTLLTTGTENVFNYNSAAIPQTVTTGSSIVYRNLYLNNTYVSGVTLNTALTAADVTGDLKTQSGLFINGGFAITGNATEIFQVENGATFQMTGTAAFPTAFGTYTFGLTSITEYWQTNAQTVVDVGSPGYGRLYCQPYANAVAQTMPASTINVQSNLVVGNGTHTGTLDGSATSTLNVIGALSISANGTFDATNVNTNVGGNWTNNGTFTPGAKTVTFNGSGAQEINGNSSSQTFYNVTVDKSGGALTVNAAVNTLNVNNFTNAVTNSGTFTAPLILNLNASATASMILNGGTFTAGLLTTINGDWTNNGGTYTPGTGIVQFIGGSNVNINGTATSQTFYNVDINKSAGSVSVGGSTTTLNIHDFTQTAFDFDASGASTLFNVTNNFIHNAGTFTPSANITIGKNITNNATGLTWGTSVTCNGTTAQTISGSAAMPNFTDFILDNTHPYNAVTLSTPITVDNQFTLTDGHLVTTVSNILTLSATAAIPAISGTIDSSFVRGPMVHSKSSTGAEIKFFPVGKGNTMNKAYLTVNHSNTVATTYTGEYFNSSAVGLGYTLPATLDTVSRVGYWDISKNGAGSVVSAYVQLFYVLADSVLDAPNLSVAKGNPSAWVDLGGTGTAVPDGNITSTISFNTFSKFALANKKGGLNPLPIELLSFDAKANGEVVDLFWATATEINNDYFTLEKTTDGVNFEEIGTFLGAGNSTAILNYETVDDNPTNGISYYRLKQTDFDGKFTYSDLKMVAFNKENIFSIDIYPNPSSDGMFNLLLNSDSKEKVLVVVYDVLGNEMFSEIIITNDSGKTIHGVDPSKKLPSGVYMIIATSDDTIYNKKLIVN